MKTYVLLQVWKCSCVRNVRAKPVILNILSTQNFHCTRRWLLYLVLHGKGACSVDAVFCWAKDVLRHTYRDNLATGGINIRYLISFPCILSSSNISFLNKFKHSLCIWNFKTHKILVQTRLSPFDRVSWWRDWVEISKCWLKLLNKWQFQSHFSISAPKLWQSMITLSYLQRFGSISNDKP